MEYQPHERTLDESSEPESSLPTRQGKRGPLSDPPRPPSTPPVAPESEPTQARANSALLTLSIEALRKEERARLRITVQVLIGMACLGLLMTPLIGGDPFAKKVLVGGLAWSVVSMGVLLRNSYVSESYDVEFIGVGVFSLCISYVCTLYYFGLDSAAAMTGALGLYIFCLGGSQRWSAAVYAGMAGGHAGLASFTLAGLIEERGFVRTNHLPVRDQIVLQVCVQAVYGLAFVAARTSRRKSESVFGDLEHAARRISQRDALLNEAKRELERAAWVGGEGRFTEQLIGSFRLGKIIGRGGMGEVYEAVHIETGEEAAVKLLQRNVFADPQAMMRFSREATAACALDSPYVVRVLEVPGEDATIPYLAMERLRGEDLASTLRREHSLSAREQLKLVEQVGCGLDAARAAGVVHRDIKPQNLFLSRRDNASSQWKVLDFGVSKLVGQGSFSEGVLVGTPEYMAPEQASGRPIDHRADLYGLCAVLYRCVASRAPFSDSSLAALVHRVVTQMPPRPGDLGRVSADVEAVLAIGLSKNPDDRFNSGAELAEAFAQALNNRLPEPLRARAQRILDRTPWADY